MKTERKGTAIKCTRCKQQCYFRTNDVYLNEYEQRCIRCECGKEIVLKRK